MTTITLRRLIQSVDNGTWGDEPKSEDQGVYCIRAADFDFTRLRVDLSRAPLREVDTRSLRRLALKPGDLVLEKSGGGEVAPVGRAVLFEHNVTAVTSNFAARVRPASGTDPTFLVYLLRSLYDSGRTLECIKQTTGIQNLDTEHWLNTPVVKPSESEQRRIADFLDDHVARINQIIAARRRQRAAIEARFAAVRRNAVLGLSGSVRPTELPWAAEVGADRRVRRLGQMTRMGTGHTPSRSEPDYWINCDIPWITTSDVHRFRQDQIDDLSTTELQLSEVGIAKSAAVIHPSGTVALSRTASAGFSIVMNRDMATSQDFVTWTCGPELRPLFLLHILRIMRPYLLGYLAMGSTHKTIYFPDLMDIRVPIPPVTRQEEAIREVRSAADQRGSLVATMERQVELLQEYRRSLITAAVTGEVDVTTASERGLPA